MGKKRKLNPYSDKAMAEFLGVSAVTVHNWKTEYEDKEIVRKVYLPARLGFIAVKNGLTESDIKALVMFKKSGDDSEEHN